MSKCLILRILRIWQYSTVYLWLNVVRYLYLHFVYYNRLPSFHELFMFITILSYASYLPYLHSLFAAVYWNDFTGPYSCTEYFSYLCLHVTNRLECITFIIPGQILCAYFEKHVLSYFYR